MLFSHKSILSYSQRLRRLRILASVLLLALMVPLISILYFGYQQLQTNVLLDYKRTASKLEQIIDNTLTKRRISSDSLPLDAFGYYRQVYNPYTRQTQQSISPLANLDFDSPDDAWLVGYFQYCNRGHFNSPVWFDSAHDHSSFEMEEEYTHALASERLLEQALQDRKNRADQLDNILQQSDVIQHMLPKLRYQHFTDDEASFQVAFDVPEYFIFYRVVIIAEQYWLQGYVVKREAYLSQLVQEVLQEMYFGSSVLVELADDNGYGLTEYFFYENLPNNLVKVSVLDNPDTRFQQQQIHSYHHFAPFDGYRLTLTTDAIPITSAMIFSIVFIFVLIVAIFAACFGFYRLGIQQLALGEQRLNFVSSVTHELKTPLTSISMYAQMLKEKTLVSEAHRDKYVDFIFGESERLTRLINNILQLSAVSRPHNNIQPQYTPLPLLVDIIRSKTSSIIETQGFEQNIVVDIPNADTTQVLVDQDAFAQVVINITENAIKFFDTDKIRNSKRQKIDFNFRLQGKNNPMLELEIRDYGQGVTQEQQSKMFDLFYRGGNELTRTTQGTGIGLAIVKELVTAQQGEISVERKKPGLALVVCFLVN